MLCSDLSLVSVVKPFCRLLLTLVPYLLSIGCLTTVSTFVAELVSAREAKHALIYGAISIAAAQALLLLINGVYVLS